MISFLFSFVPRLALYLLVCIFVCACQPQPETAELPLESEVAEAPTELTEQLQPGAALEMIAGHLLDAEHRAIPTRALATHYADMTRETAYGIQLLSLGEEISEGGRLIGWKMGGTRVTDPTSAPDPSFAYILATDSLDSGERVYPDTFVGDSVLVEAEIAFVMGEDLSEPVSSKAELLDAVESVVGAIELISIRILPALGGDPPSTNLMIAARLSHAGVMLSEERFDPSTIDLEAETVVVEVDGVEVSSGAAGQIMNSSPLDALMWLTNELPRHGLGLRAGDVVITGSLYDNPTLKASQTAVVRFSSLGDLSVSLAE